LSALHSGIRAAYEPVILSNTRTKESVYPVGRVQLTVPVVPAAEHEDEILVGGGIACEHETVVLVLIPTQDQDQVLLFSELFILVPILHP
jgi:hypothetical protein